MESDEVLLIQMRDFSTECWVCGEACTHDYGIPVWEDLVLPNDHRGEWGGVSACRECYDQQQKLLQPMNQIEFLGNALTIQEQSK